MSGGEQQMLAVGRALMSNRGCSCSTSRRPDWPRSWRPRPTPRSAALREQGLAILVAEQQVPLALGLADAGYVLENGRIQLQGTSAELGRQPRGPAGLPAECA